MPLPKTEAAPTSEHSHRTYLIFGPGGCGKSYFANTFPGPHLILDWDQRIPFLPPDPTRQRIPYLVDDPTKARDIWAKFRNDVHQLCSAPELPYQTIILDSLSAAASCLESWALIIAGKDPLGATKKDRLTIQDHGDISSQLNGLFSSIRTCRAANFVCLAHEMPLDDKDEKLHGWYPICPGKKIQHRLSDIFGEVYHMRYAQGEYILEWDVDNYSTCTRLLPRRGQIAKPFLVNPSYTRMMAIAKAQKRS